MKKWPTVAGNIATWGGVKLTGRDITPDIQTIAAYQGAHRYTFRECYTGSKTVNPNSGTIAVSVSGLGYCETLQYIQSNGIPASNSWQIIYGDLYYMYLACRPCIADLPGMGLTTVGSYNLGSQCIHVGIYNDAIYQYIMGRVSTHFPIPFRNSLLVSLQNTHPSLTATMAITVTYYLFTASKMVLAKLSSFKDAKEIRKKFKQEKLGCSAVIVERLGYFEDENQHPYKEFLKDLPNRFDMEVGALKTKSASENVQNFVLTLYVEEDTSLGKINQLVKPEKILYEEEL